MNLFIHFFWTEEDCANIETGFSKDRTSLPLVVLATPYDKGGAMWTQHHPTAPILRRVVLLARESIAVLRAQLDSVQALDVNTVDFKVSTIVMFSILTTSFVKMFIKLAVFIRKKIHNYTTSNDRLTSTIRPPSAAFFENCMFSCHCSLDGVASNTTSNVRLTSTIRPPSAAFFGN